MSPLVLPPCAHIKLEVERSSVVSAFLQIVKWEARRHFHVGLLNTQDTTRGPFHLAQHWKQHKTLLGSADLWHREDLHSALYLNATHVLLPLEAHTQRHGPKYQIPTVYCLWNNIWGGILFLVCTPSTERGSLFHTPPPCYRLHIYPTAMRLSSISSAKSLQESVFLKMPNCSINVHFEAALTPEFDSAESLNLPVIIKWVIFLSRF